MVDDLLLLWNGIPIINSTQKIIKAALLCVSSDMPALRKVSQYLGHKADLGCPRCNFMAERIPQRKVLLVKCCTIHVLQHQTEPMPKCETKPRNTCQLAL